MKYAWLLVLVVATLIVSCDDENTPPPPEPSMTILEAPQALGANQDSCYAYRVQLANVEADSIMVEVRAPDGSVHSTFALYDDGGALPSMPPAYACGISGDIWANNGQFTRRINARLLANSVTGAYRFTFIAPGVGDQFRIVQIQNVEPCLITSYPSDQAFETCFSPVQLEVRVARSDVDAVDTVRVHIETLEVPVILSHMDFVPFSGDSIWRATMTPRFFECVPSGAYTLVYTAKTRFGMECSQSVMPVTYTNMLPLLSNSILPDTAYRPPALGDSNLIVVTVDMDDCELEGATDFFGVDDYPGVKFDVHRDSNPWGHDRLFFLRDDGVSPDENGGDGTYSSWLVIKHDTTGLVNNMYYFRFYAVDCAAPNDTSQFLLDSIRIIQSSVPNLVGVREQVGTGSYLPVLN